MCIVNIREAKLRDIGDILDIEKRSFGLEAFSAKFFFFLLRKCGNLFFVAEACNRVLGYVVGCIEGEYGHIYSIAVDPAFRRRGLGSKLLEKILEEYRQMGVKKVILEVRESNVTARRFYEKHGFRFGGRRKGYYSNGEDAIIMERII